MMTSQPQASSLFPGLATAITHPEYHCHSESSDQWAAYDEPATQPRWFLSYPSKELESFFSSAAAGGAGGSHQAEAASSSNNSWWGGGAVGEVRYEQGAMNRSFVTLHTAITGIARHNARFPHIVSVLACLRGVFSPTSITRISDPNLCACSRRRHRH